MQNVVAFMPVSSQAVPIVWHARDAGDPTHQLVPEHHTDEEFITLLDSYRDSGGLARSQELFVMFGLYAHSNVAMLAQWIGRRHVISFDWDSKIWLPLFQFNRSEMTLQPQPGLSQVLTELGAVFDCWEIAHWFTQPNAWIEDQTPVATLKRDVFAVLNAARADRFIAAG